MVDVPPGLPFSPERITEWSQHSDLATYLLHVASQSHSITLNGREARARPANVVTRTSPGPAPDTQVFVVYNGLVYSQDHVSPPRQRGEAVIDYASSAFRKGAERLIGTAGAFMDSAAQDVADLVERSDPLIEEIQRTHTPQNAELDTSAPVTVLLRDLKYDDNFGYMAKYAVAWDAISQRLLEDADFFSLPHLLESSKELECSILLAQNAYYKQALQVLRNFIESVVLELHFCDNADEYESWKRGQYRTPPLRGKDGLLLRMSDDGLLPVELGIETGDLYGKLNGSIHGAETALLHSGVVHGSKGKFGFKYERLAEWCQMFGNCAYVALRVLERCIDMWEQRKRDRLMCWTCHSLGTFSVVATISMMDQDFTSVRCGNCGNEQTYIAQHIRDCGIR